VSVADPKCFVRLKEPIPGIDHIKFIDHRELAEAHHLIDRIASLLGVDGINDFYVYKGEYGSAPVRWHSAADGLRAFRVVKTYIENHESLPELASADYRARTLDVLVRLDELLSEAHCRDIRLCITGNY
jgi:hypothetical protein